MKNIINEKPKTSLHGRLLSSMLFVEDADIKDKRVLDIGCGYGWFELNILKRGVGQAVGMEISAKNLETAKRSINDNKIIFKVGMAADLPFEDNSFDTVILWEVLEHIPRKTENKVYQEVRRVLKDNGVFYLSTPHKSFFSIVLDPAWWLIGHRHYSQKELMEYAKNNGFRIERILVKGGWWEIIAIWDLYIAKWLFRRRPFFEDDMNKKIDSEYNKDNGFATIMIKNTVKKS